ncbi:CPBP family intramembrane glutamic endopeptidase [Palaeococcus ferrophilus]|uniref:CPBP family intramembrane glutamic endopeptidase n=1 Tax=Palaeococcus ferrophilus TaxID=83868 RepID=UPI00064E530B|nr:CPBP family intramembrane glutamic endopeptidase [Palaeococcus ferrophilus]
MLKFLLVVFALSWPLQFMGYPHASMLAVALGTFVVVHLEGGVYPGITLRRGSELLKAALFGIVVFLPAFYASPAFRRWFMGQGAIHALVALLLQIALYVIYAYGEEVGWRGYLFPVLVERFTPMRALWIHNGVWALWHAPLLLVLGGGMVEFIANLLGAFVHASLFAYFYHRGGLAVSVLYHALWSGLRDVVLSTGGVEGLYLPGMVVVFIGTYLTLMPNVWMGGGETARC